ncbi:MAG TPA: SPFH domain-containing protein [Thermomicrobiales bacterium]|nr:SPFH domain-containing protein [Thermomicrobiales bacterium]
MNFTSLVIIVVILVVVLLLILSLAARLYRKVGPNQALIVYGFGGTKVVKGSGRVVWPMVQTSRELSLELMSFDVAPQQDLYTAQGVAVNVEAVAQIKVKSDPVSILTASEQFLSMNDAERQGLIRLVMEGHLRGIVGQLTVESIVKEPEMVADRMRSNVVEDTAKMGLEVVSFTIREVRDNNDYILNMGKPDVALVRRQAEIATAEAERDIAIRRAQALRESKIAEAAAEQEKVTAESISQTKQAEALRDLELKKAEYDRSVQEQRAQADKAYEIQTNVQQQRVVEEQVRVERVRKEGEIAVQEAEIQRREKELVATVLKAAEAERKRIETLAEAERQREILRASAQAEATRLQGESRAKIVRIEGLAEAEIIEAKGQAEAKALQVKAGAYRDYNQAGLIDRLLSELPDVVRAAAEPLNKVDKITVISTGGDGAGGGTGVNRITSDLSSLVAQVPALVESLTGIDMQELLKHVPNASNDYQASEQREVPVARKPEAKNPPTPRVDAEPVRPDSAPVGPMPASANNGSGAGSDGSEPAS